MSYLTKLNITAEGGTPEERVAVLSLIAASLRFRDVIEPDPDSGFYGQCWRSSIDEDMRNAADVTKGHPEVTVSVEADGQDPDDYWLARMRDGRYERKDMDTSGPAPFGEILLPGETGPKPVSCEGRRLVLMGAGPALQVFCNETDNHGKLPEEAFARVKEACPPDPDGRKDYVECVFDTPEDAARAADLLRNHSRDWLRICLF